MERDGEYWLYITIEREVNVPDPIDCKTVIGVDIGVNRLAVAIASNKEHWAHKPLYIHGELIKHLQNLRNDEGKAI